MQLLKNKGNFELLTTTTDLKKQLLLIEEAGRTCYQSDTGKITQKTARNFSQMLIKRGHLSVLEHSRMSVKFVNISRGFTHEMVRHRLASYSQESTRYVDYAKPGAKNIDLSSFEISVISPPHCDANKKIAINDNEKLSFKEIAGKIENYYRALRKDGWNPEDARQILPIGLKSEIIVTANFREWQHIFKMRTSQYAHWEIRAVMVKLLKKIKPTLSPIFDAFNITGKDYRGVEYTTTK